jgi:hypothetical protein
VFFDVTACIEKMMPENETAVKSSQSTAECYLCAFIKYHAQNSKWYLWFHLLNKLITREE